MWRHNVHVCQVNIWHRIVVMTTDLWFKDIVSSRIDSHHFGAIHSCLPAAQLVYTAAE